MYAELCSVVANRLKGERENHTLQPTALVNEAFVRIVNINLSFENRNHFLAICWQVMRQALVDHARHRKSKKRQSDLRVELYDDNNLDNLKDENTDKNQLFDILLVDQLLTRLEKKDPIKHKLLALYYFGGFSQKQLSNYMKMPLRSLEREMRFAKVWLLNELQSQNN